jgi:tetratricopeptide (TPR) repeat protein
MSNGARQGFDVKHPEWAQATAYLRAGKSVLADPLVRLVLKRCPDDVLALRVLADIEVKAQRYRQATTLLQRCIKLDPDYALARRNYIALLIRNQEVQAALREVTLLLKAHPENPTYHYLKATILIRLGEHPTAISLFEGILTNHPRRTKVHLSYGHALKAVGRVEEAIIAYRRAIDINPRNAEAYWSLANLKTFRFTNADIGAMRLAICSQNDTVNQQPYLAFALAKALEDRELYKDSFKYYEQGNAMRHAKHRYNSTKNTANTVSHLKTCTTEFFAQREDWGCPATDPIFIVGLPRSGSTLLEQILASHSVVDGTGERPDIIAISRQLRSAAQGATAIEYPQHLATLSRQQCVDLGENYLSRTRVQRGQAAFFVDKMPNNFLHIGLIHLILPNARIIDARRHPMANCFACYKQLFAQGQTFTYHLKDLAHYYRNYVKVMDHWDNVLPDKILRVEYEHMVNNPERHIRRLLEHCDLPFEDRCLLFHDTKRTVRTPSAEQVRLPIFTGGLEQWRHYQEHLSPLKEGLGPPLQHYR